MAFEKLNKKIESLLPADTPPEHTLFEVLTHRAMHHELDSLLRAAWEYEKGLAGETIPY